MRVCVAGAEQGLLWIVHSSVWLDVFAMYIYSNILLTIKGGQVKEEGNQVTLKQTQPMSLIFKVEDQRPKKLASGLV